LQTDVIFDEDTRREFLVSIDKDADTLTRLVDDLLMMSRLEANALEVKRIPQSLKNVIYAVRDRLESLTVKHHLRINIPDNLPRVIIDEGRIGEVLTNLVENAVKFSDDGTTITISAVSLENTICISVRDEGIGIRKKSRKRYLNGFFKARDAKLEEEKVPASAWLSAGASWKHTAAQSA
jgi:K+-sensing histidine kinase KdpD